MTTLDARQDIHRPSSLEFDPAKYECVGIFDLHPEESEEDERKARLALVNSLVEKGIRFAGGGSNCGHCGTHIRYGALMVREDVKEMIWVGETCLDARFSLNQADFQYLRETSRLNRDRMTRAEKKAMFLADNKNATMLMEYEASVDAIPTFLASLAMQLDRNGFLSEKQLAMIPSAIQKDKEASARLIERETQKQELLNSGVQAPEGKVTVEGEIVGFKVTENDYGTVCKMIVKVEAGWAVYVTQPANLEVEKGDRVRFIATLTQSPTDPLFAFGKRPTKAEVIK